MEIFTQIITSTIVVGIFTFIFKESFKAKLESVKKDVEHLRSYQEKDFNYASDAIKVIWSNFAKLDDYLRYDYPIEISKGNISSENLRPFLLSIRENMALLPDELYSASDRSLEKLADSWNNASNTIVAITKKYHGKPTEHETLLNEANIVLDKMKEEIKGQLIELRGNFRAYISKHSEKS